MWQRIRRWLTRFAITLFALCAIGIGLALGLAHTDWGREQIRRIAEAQLQKKLPGARIGRIEGSVFGELTVRDLELPAAGGGLFARVGAARIAVALWPLVEKRVQIERVVIDDAEVFPLRQLVVVPNPDPLTWYVEMPAIEVNRARAVIETARQTVTIDGLRVTGRAAVPGEEPITAAIALSGTWRERTAPVEGTLELRVVGRRIEVPAIALKAGGVTLSGKDLAIEAGRPSGRLEIDAPAAALTALVPEVILPADAKAVVTAVDEGGQVRLEVAGSLGASKITGVLRADLDAVRVRGVITARDAELAEITRGRVTGRGSVFAAVVADRARIRGTAIASGEVRAFPAHAVVSFDALVDGTSVRGLVLGAGRSDQRPVGGEVAVTAVVGGTLAPLAVRGAGAIDGERVVYRSDDGEATRVRRVRARFSADATRELLVAEVGGTAGGIARASGPLGDATFGGTYRGGLSIDQPIAAWARARLAAAPIDLAASGKIRPGATTRIELGTYSGAVRGGARWGGRGGRVTIDPAAIVVERVQLANGSGRVGAAVTYARATKRLELSLDTRSIALSSIDPAYRGVASGRVELARRGERWDGTVALAATGLVFAPGTSPIDGDVRGTIAGRRIQLEAAASTAALGRARVALDVDGPRDLLDVDGWRLLRRPALRSVRIDAERVDLAVASVSTGGVVDGTLTIAGASTSGTMKIRGVRSPIGDVEGDITFTPEENDQIGASSTARIRGFGDADVSARIALPDHPFDPDAWSRLGRGALVRLGASFSDIAFDPARLAILRVPEKYRDFRGRGDISVVIADGGKSASIDVELADILGGPLVRPIDVRVAAQVDAVAGTSVRGSVHNTRDQRSTLVSFEAAVPSFTLDRWIAAPAQARTAPITGGVVTIGGPDPIPATLIAAIFGRTEVVAGTAGGRFEIGGTVGTPTASGRLTLAKLAVAPRIAGKGAPPPTDIAIDARWGGSTGRVSARATSADGWAVATASGDPRDLARATATLEAQRFQLAAIAPLLPFRLTALEGTLRANLQLRGLASIAELRGTLGITRARLPIDPMIGTLRDGTVDARISPQERRVELAGKLGRGTVKITATSPRIDLAVIDVAATLDRVSPIGAWEPMFRASIAAQFRRPERAGGPWTGAITVHRGASAVLPESRSQLGDPDAPEDMLFVEDGPIAVAALGARGRPPERPWLVADVDIQRIKVLAEDHFDTRADVLARRLQLSIGETVGLRGRIDIENGIVGDLFGRRYDATGYVRFDGTLQPDVHIALKHKFTRADLEVSVLLDGDPETLVPRFTGDSGTYTQDQLLGFVLGAEPGGDPTAQTREAATGATAAVLSTAIGGRIKKRLPIKIEQLACDPGSSVTAASCTAGKWLGAKLFIAFKRRIDARVTENANEVQSQYYLRRDLYFEGSAGDAGSGGIDLLWRRRW